MSAQTDGQAILGSARTGIGMQWPEDGSPAEFSDLVGPLVDAFNAGASWRRKPGMDRSDIPWTGLPLPHIGAGCPEARLSADWRRIDRDQGRSFLETVLGLALNLGMAQGQRVERERQKSVRDFLWAGIQFQQHALDQLEADAKPAPVQAEPGPALADRDPDPLGEPAADAQPGLSDR